MAGTGRTEEQLDREWSDAWWAEDYSWDGLARMDWAGWFVHADGLVRDEDGNAWPPEADVGGPPSMAPSPPSPEAGEVVPKGPEGAIQSADMTAPTVSPAGAGDPPPPVLADMGEATSTVPPADVASTAEGGGGGAQAQRSATEGAETSTAVIPGEGDRPRPGTHGEIGTGGGMGPGSPVASLPAAGMTVDGQPAKPRPATLQEYWRADPVTGAARTDAELEALGELTRDPSGALWHVVHVPTRWKEPSPLWGGSERSSGVGGGAASQNTEIAPAEGPPTPGPSPQGGGGRPTWKTDLSHPDWARIDALVAARVGAGAETKVDWRGNATGRDGRAQLDGAVLKSLSARSRPKELPKAASGREGNAQAVHIRASQARFLEIVNCTGWVFGPGAQFTFATFSGLARFDSATFSGDAGFSSATFSAGAVFSSATFSAGAVFANATFSGYARFDSATFSGDAGFTSATFSGDAQFEGATFSRNAWFAGATFSWAAGFENVTFYGATAFLGATFSLITRFARATFSGDARFTSATFSGIARFESATFHGEAGFESATFSGAARFAGATFSGKARFQSATFSGDAVFKDAVFALSATFAGAAEANEVEAATQTLALTVSTPGEDGSSKAEGALTTPASDSPLKRRSFRLTDFSGAVFGGEVDFSNRTFLAATSFSGTVLGGLAKFHDAKLHQDTNFTHADFREAGFAPRKIVVGTGARDPTPAEALAQRDAHYAAYERADRTLKLAMEGHRARREEARFYRLELEARRKRPARSILGSARGDTSRGASAAPSGYWLRPPGLSRDVEQTRKEVTAIEKGVSWLYGLASGYGDSLLAPIGALTVLWLAFALIYGALAGVFLEAPAPACLAAEGATAACPSLQTLLVFSGRHTFLPVVMTDPDQAQWWFDATRASPLIPFLAEFIHRLASAVLIFLFALALRRRFQIN